MYAITLGLFLGYEIQKLIQFNFFFRIKCILSDYNKHIFNKINSVAFKELVKLTIIDFIYLISIIVNLFTVNLYFAASILLLSFIQGVLFKNIKNKPLRKILYVVDIILTILLLSLSIINILYFKTDGLNLIKQLLCQV